MNIKLYEKMMSSKPLISELYLYDVLFLQRNQKIHKIIVNNVIESNTALVIKFSVIIKTPDSEDIKQKFIIKTIKSSLKQNVYHNLSIKEAEFYKMIMERNIDILSIPYCYDAFISDDKSKYLILLKDISNEYVDTNKLNLKDENIWFATAKSLAIFHSKFWNLKNINSVELPIKGKETIDSDIKKIYKSFEKFKNYVKDRFNSKTYAIYEHVIKIQITVIKDNQKRLLNKLNLTLIHGDSHIHNFMVSPTQNVNPIIIDFQFWGLGNGVGDLAHLTRGSFPKKFSITLHKLIVEKYYNTLIENDIKDYSWELCWKDYKKRVATMLLVPMWQYCLFGLTYDDWKDDVDRLILNYKVLQCDKIKG